MDKKKQSVSLLLSRFRGWIQAAATLLTNIHLPNFFKGGIYQGKGKTVCVPGLNCYSCPAASGACPIGAFQAVVGSSKFRFSYYITGILILLGVLLGRFICGFLCPFGWLQELLHKIPGKKLSTKKLRPLTYLKYVILLLAVVLLPALIVNDVGMGDPYFCKYICPQGVLEGAIPLAAANESIRAALGALFTRKLIILIAVVVLSVLFFRPFCKWICPLGAFYALMNKVSLLGIQVDTGKCISCGQMRAHLPDGRGHHQVPQRHGMHPLRQVHPRLPHASHPLPLWLRPERKHESETSKQPSKSNGGIMMKKITKFVTLLLALAMVFSLAACSSGKGKDKADGSADIATLIATEPNSADEAAKLYQQLMQKENDILAANSELWNKVFLSANKNSTMIEDGTNYGDFLLATIESAKDSFSADELKTLKAGAEQIKEIEGKLTILEQKYPGCGTAPGAGDSVSAEEAGMTASGSNAMKFPSFQGKDLNGNDVDSSKLFAGNSVTVVNFWFTTCNPCVGELADLEALNKDLAAKGGAVVGINSFTLDGDKTAIAEAKDILAKKGVTYSNLWFASDSEAGKFTAGLYSFPTTYVVDKNGNIVGQPIVGGITAPDQAKKLNELIDQALASSK